MMNRPWPDKDIAKALKLKAGGLTYAEIGKAIDRTPGAVSDFFYRQQNGDPRKRDGRAIGLTQEDRRFANDAVRGSERLLAEIERVFGRVA